MKAFLSPKWLGRHALLLVVLVVLARVGWWQWETAQQESDWQNYGYAVQWWLFAGFAVFLWVKLVLDELDPSRVQDQPDARPLPQPDRRPTAAAVDDEDDDELAAYNRHLARLAEQARE